MKLIKQTEVIMPEWAICYLEYGDTDNLTAEDVAEVDSWLERLAKLGYTSPTFDYQWEHEGNGFYYYPAFGLGTQCVRTIVSQFE